MENQAVKPPILLIVEPDPIELTEMAAILDQKGYRTFLARNAEVAAQAAQTIPFDLILYSFKEEALVAAESAARIRKPEAMSDTPVLFLADRLEVRWIEPLNMAGGVYCLPRPYESEKLLELVERAICIPHVAGVKVSPARPHFATDWVKLH